MDTVAAFMGDEVKDHSIVDFLARPIRVKTFTWETSAVLGSNLQNISVMSVLANANSSPKVRGFRYFRADIELIVVANSQPFQQGALLLAYFPLSATNDPQYSSIGSLTGATGTLSEVMLLEDDAPGVLRVPFNHPEGYLDLCNLSLTDLGIFYINVYGVLAPSAVEFTMYVRFLNVKLVGPTDERLDPDIVPSLVGQVGPPDEAAEQVQEGVVTRISGTVATVADALTDIPIIGSIARPISWIASAVNAVASFFGWSKPVNVSTTAVNKITTARFMANYNGVDTSNSLGLEADNQIAPFPFFGEQDVMALDAIITRLNYVGTVPLTTSIATSTEIAKFAVNPMVGAIFTKEVNTSQKLIRYTSSTVTYLAYVASMFKFWHGPLRFSFRAVKTKFHSGRLLVSWRPGTSHYARTIDVPMAYSVVWDLAKNNSLVVDVPYMNPKPWLRVPPIAGIATPSLASTDSDNGILAIAVLNKLVAANDIVSQTIGIIVEVAAAPGMKFSFPLDPKMMPVTTTSYDPPIPTKDFVAQIGTTVAPISIVPDGNEIIPFGPEKLSAGEAVVSFRQLIKRFTPMILFGDSPAGKLPSDLNAVRNWFGYKTPMPNSSTLMISNIVQRTDVFAFMPKTFNIGNSGGKDAPVGRTDLLTYVSGLFAYYRGGTRLKVVLVPTDLVGRRVPAIARTALLDETGAFNTQASFSGAILAQLQNASILTNFTVEGAVEVQVPYYSNFAYTPCRISIPQSTYHMVLTQTTDLTSVGYIPMSYRAAADDFEFLFPIGVPLVQWVPLPQ